MSYDSQKYPAERPSAKLSLRPSGSSPEATRERRRSRALLRWSAIAALGALAAPATAQDRIVAADGQALDWFGYDVAMSGDVAVVGSWRDDDAGSETGSAHIVFANGSEPASYVQKLRLDDMAAGDRAGLNVAIGKGGSVVCITAPGRSSVRPDGSVMDGAVAVFEENAGVWRQVALLDDPSRSTGDLFGSGVAIDGNHILVGAPRDDEFASDGGALYVFGASEEGYTRLAKLAPTDVGVQDFFGHDVAASGGKAVSSAYNDDDAGTNAGAAYALERVGDTWSVVQKLEGSEGNGFDFFGTCVAMSENTIVVGAPQNEDLDAEARINEGAAFVYEWNDTTRLWVETFVLRPGAPNDNNRFGIDVAVSDTRIVVGSSNSDVGVVNSGSAHIFTRRSRDRFELLRHLSPTAQAYDYLGLSVAAGRNAVIVGIPGANGVDVGTGAIDVINGSATSSWASSYCHSGEEVQGFKNMGGEMNRTGNLGRLCAVGSPSIERDDLILRSTGLPEGSLAVLFLGASDSDTPFGQSRLCVAGGQTGFLRFPFQTIDSTGRYIVRQPTSRVMSSVIGIGSFLASSPIYAQVIYREDDNSDWNTTNALRMQLTP